MRKILLALLLSLWSGLALAADNYTATQGTGTTFGAKDFAGVLYPRMIMCDPTTVLQCVSVDASGRLTLVPNQPLNTAQINGVTVLMGNGATGTGSQRVTLSNDNTIPTGWPTATNQTAAAAAKGEGATGAAVPFGAQYVGLNAAGNLTGWTAKAGNTYAATDVVPGVAVVNTLATVGNNADDVAASASAGSPVINYNYVWDSVGGNWDRQPKSTTVANPCETVSQSYTTGVITSATTTRIIAPSASNKTYLCMFFTKASAIDNVAVVEGTGGTCGTGTAALLGGTTTANGLVFGTAGDGVLLQAGGKVSVIQTAGTNVDTCLITSTAGPLIWSAKYVQAP